MLGNCILRNPTTMQGAFDKGAVCESLLFFTKTHLLVDTSTLAQIVKANFLDDFIEFLKRGYLTANYSPQTTGLLNDTVLGMREHRFVIMKLGGNQETGIFKRNQDMLEFELKRHLGDPGKAKAYYRQLRPLLSFEDLDADGATCAAACDDVADPQFARDLAQWTLINKGIPSNELSFGRLSILKLGENRFVIETDIEFDRLRKYLPADQQGSFSKDDLFPGLMEARLNVYLGAKNNAAFIGNGNDQIIIDRILRKSLGTRFNSDDLTRALYDFISVETPSVREVINGGVRAPREFIRLLDSATGFRKWLGEQNPDKKLIEEMLREKSRTDWLSSVPGRMARFGLFTGGGIIADVIATGGIGTAIGVGAAALDSFAVDRLSARWRPHYFIENNLKSFLDVQSRGEAAK